MMHRIGNKLQAIVPRGASGTFSIEEYEVVHIAGDKVTLKHLLTGKLSEEPRETLDYLSLSLLEQLRKLTDGLNSFREYLARKHGQSA
jgi:hypothetical protein